MINLANSDITGIKLGNDEIARVYLGNDLIYQNKKWVFKKKGTHYSWDYKYKETFFIDEGSYLFVLTGGNMLFVDVIGGNKEIASGGIAEKFPGDNANVITVKNGTITLVRGSFNRETKTFKRSYTIAKNIPNKYDLTVEVYCDMKVNSYYEYYELE